MLKVVVDDARPVAPHVPIAEAPQTFKPTLNQRFGVTNKRIAHLFDQECPKVLVRERVLAMDN